MAKLLPGNSDDIVKQNQKALCGEGMGDAQAWHLALKHAKKATATSKAIKGTMKKKPEGIEIT